MELSFQIIYSSLDYSGHTYSWPVIGSEVSVSRVFRLEPVLPRDINTRPNTKYVAPCVI